MCSFFRWANSEFHIESPMKNVPAPRFQKVEIEPFTREEVSRMLRACTYSKEADGSVRQFGEQSTDKGKTWAPAFDFTYRKSASAPPK